MFSSNFLPYSQGVHCTFNNIGYRRVGFVDEKASMYSPLQMIIDPPTIFVYSFLNILHLDHPDLCFIDK